MFKNIFKLFLIYFIAIHWANAKNSHNVKILTLNDESLASSKLQRQELKYLISCALPKHYIIKAKYKNSIYFFKGSAGLAPNWINNKLNINQQRIVSACMLARTNYYGKQVKISLAHNSYTKNIPKFLYRTKQEKIDYPIFEGAFFGNILTNHSKAYVCTGNANEKYLRSKFRICSLEIKNNYSYCNFKIVGKCTRENFIQDNIDYIHQALNVYLKP